MQVNYAGMIGLSTVDWFGKAARVLFFRGCPMHCPHCINVAIKTGNQPTEMTYLYHQIVEAQRFVDVIVLSGGEPLVQPEACADLVEMVHSLGMKIGIETSGCRPLVPGFDMVMLTIKTSLRRGLYDSYVGLPGAFDTLLSNLKQMHPKRSEIRLILFKDNPMDAAKFEAIQGFPIRVMAGEGPNVRPSQEELVAFSRRLANHLGYRTAEIQNGRVLLVC